MGKYQTALIISGLVTFIAAYHYMRIFNSWTEAYHYSLEHKDPQLTGIPFNDAYRYMDFGERWLYWKLAMLPFCYIVYELLVGLAAARSSETNDQVRALIFRAQWVTVVSWLTYPVVYVFPMMGFSGARAVVAIQVGYCVSDIISKCGVGLIIYSITSAKSQLEKDGALLS